VSTADALGGEAIGSASALAAAVAIGASFAALQALDSYPLGLGQGLRYAVATLALLALLRGRVRLPPRAIARRLLVATLTGSVLFNALALIAVEHSNSGTVGVVVGAVPILVALLAPLLVGRRPSATLVGWASLATVGAALVQIDGGAVGLGGVACAVGALACEVVFLLLAGELVLALGPLQLAFWMCAISTPAFAAISLLAGEPLTLATPSEVLAIIYLGIFVSAIALVLWNIGVARLGAQRLSLFAAAIPVAILLVGVALGQLALSPLRAAGALLVAVAIAVGARGP
jgi:drug/metabolite transporter (DMT)-like permease